ncbi:hypothetical protein OK016_02075 [Vibrio chagasii]|nr:hypothetical protein [Vibrio chagasii]
MLYYFNNKEQLLISSLKSGHKSI